MVRFQNMGMASVHRAGAGARHFRHTVITAFKIRIEKLMITAITHCDGRAWTINITASLSRETKVFLIFADLTLHFSFSNFC